MLVSSCDCPMCGTLEQILNHHDRGSFRLHKWHEITGLVKSKERRVFIALVTALNSNSIDGAVRAGETIIMGVDVERVEYPVSVLRYNLIGVIPPDLPTADRDELFDSMVEASAVIVSSVNGVG